jgi:hypothetical protein
MAAEGKGLWSRLNRPIGDTTVEMATELESPMRGNTRMERLKRETVGEQTWFASISRPSNVDNPESIRLYSIHGGRSNVRSAV